MFLLRSAFWLSGAFIVMAPSAGMNLGDSARTTGERLAEQSVQAVATQVASISCESVECMMGRALITQALPTQPDPAHLTVSEYKAPVPPQRPDWAY